MLDNKIAGHGLARHLVLKGFLDEAQLQHLQSAAQQDNQPLLLYIVQQKILSSAKLAQIAAADFGLPLFALESYDNNLYPFHVLNTHLITKYHVLPLSQRGKQLKLAVIDPTDFLALDEIKFSTGLTTIPIVVEVDKLMMVLKQVLLKQTSPTFSLEELDTLMVNNEALTGMLAVSANNDIDDAPLVKFVNKILLDAIHKGASDLHFEPYEHCYRIRFRLDGVLNEVAEPPINLAQRLTVRLKILSQLDIAERRIPQDGRFKMTVNNDHTIDFRISTCPTLFGEKIVIRILDPKNTQLNIEHLGFEDWQQQLFLKAISQPQGMILVTGPTGSGKTVSLYTALNQLNTPERNISTVEDPVEINLLGINQVHVNLKAGLTFSNALRAFLRQDPDVIMVGEVRDLETAEIAIKAAQTGHLVLSTLHTNNAPETLTRLVNMGVAPFDIATSVSLIIAQRLARRLCEYCKKTFHLPPEALIKEGLSTEQQPLFTANENGCLHCHQGYKGRIGLYEILPMSETLRQLILTGGNAMNILQHARVHEKFQTLRESALKKVMMGVTSLAEINRVTKD